MNTLMLRLEGPLQSWGLRAHWEERDTAFEPTKSGVIGVLGCALGLRRDDDRLRQISEQVRMGVRVDREGIPLVDYHTTGGAKRTDGEPEGMLNAEGKLKRETDVSRRMYLMDASFLVALMGPDELVAKLAAALRTPVWPIFLGRKACVPTLPAFVSTGRFENLRAALLSHPMDESHRSNRLQAEGGRIRLILETTIGDGTLRNDAIGMPARRLFWPRAALEEWVTGTADDAINTLEG